jgi:hypothetical protein
MDDFSKLRTIIFEEGSKEQLEYEAERDYIIGRILRLIYLCFYVMDPDNK